MVEDHVVVPGEPLGSSARAGLVPSWPLEQNGGPALGQSGHPDCLPAPPAFLVQHLNSSRGAGCMGGGLEARKGHDQVIPGCHGCHPRAGPGREPPTQYGGCSAAPSASTTRWCRRTEGGFKCVDGDRAERRRSVGFDRQRVGTLTPDHFRLQRRGRSRLLHPLSLALSRDLPYDRAQRPPARRLARSPSRSNANAGTTCDPVMIG